MNILTVTSYLEAAGLRVAILVLLIVLGVMLASYNWLYLYHSLHVSSRHMGLNAPIYIKKAIKMSITLAVFTALLGLFFLLTRIY